MSSTVFILVAWVLLGRFDSEYDSKIHGSAPVSTMLVATVLAIIWDISVFLS